jgi:hypothetical protein
MHSGMRLGVIVLAVAVTAFAGNAESANRSSDIKAGLREAGMAALPEFLDAATENITIKFPRALGGGTLTFGGTIDADALAEKKFFFSTSDERKLTWTDAFGMSFLDLRDVALNLSIEKGAFSISLDGALGGAFSKGGKPRAVVIELSVEDRKLTDFTLSLPDTKLSLHALPEFKTLPGASKFAIEAPTVSMHAIGGKVDFLNEKVDAMLFFDGASKAWNFGLRFEKALTLADLTGHRRGFLKDLGLPRMRMITSTKGLKAQYADLPLAVRNFFAVGGKLPEGELSIPEGVNVIAAFDAAVAPGNIKSALGKIGLGRASLDIDGTVNGMFGGTPSVELTVDIDTPASHGFKFLKPKHAKAEFFIKLSDKEEALGFRTAVEMSQGRGKPALEFDVDFELAEQDGQVEVRVAGGMKGDWQNAANVKGLTLESPFVSVGITETGSFDMLIDGTVMVGSERVRASADLVLTPEAAGLPTAFALAGQINKLPFTSFAEHAKKHAAQKASFPKLNAEFKDVVFAFMSPGARLPSDLEEELSIEGAGMALKASLWVNGKELGAAGGFASTEGVKVNGKISPFKVGPLDLKDAALDIQAGPTIEPKFAMSGDIALFKGYEEKYALDLEPSKFRFSSDTKFGGAFEATLIAESDGLSFAHGNDFSFEAELAANYTKIFRDMVQSALKGLKKGEKDISKAENDVKAAERKVEGIKSKIAAEEAKARHTYDEATKKISDAEKKVESIQHTIDYNKKKAHDLDREARSDAKHLKLAKAAEKGTEEAAVKTAIASEEAALKTAQWALETAKKSVKVVPVDAAPAVVALKTQLVTEEAGLKIAQGTLEAAKGADKGIEAAVKAIGDGLTALKINRLGAAGSLAGIVSGGHEGKAPVLIIDVTIHGSRHVYREGIGTLKSEFQKLADEIAKEVAKEVLKAFEKG